MHPQISEILKLIKKYNCIIDIPTNGTLVSKYAKEIVDANIKRIWISIDGPQEQNDLQRGKGVYQRAYEGIKALQKERAINKKGPQIGVTMVITPLNYKYVKEFVCYELIPLNLDYISLEFQLYLTEERYLKHCEYLKNTFCFNDNSVSQGLVRNLDDFANIDIEDLVEQLKYVKNAISDTNIKLIGYPNYIEKDNLCKFYTGNWDEMKEYKNTCPFPWTYMEIAANGDVTPCHTFYDFKIGNVYENSIAEIWNSKEYKKFRQKIKKGLPPVCCACSRYYTDKGEK